MADGARARDNRVGASPAPGRRYAAFISYSHADEEIASWLHKRLEGYAIPAALAKGRKRRLGKVFRDCVELSTAPDLGAEIRKALDGSDALIVLCSLPAAGSKYVAEEIRTFKALGRGASIFAAIVDGEPHAASKPGRDASEECFPRALLYRVGEDGALSDEPEPMEPIAADVRHTSRWVIRSVRDDCSHRSVAFCAEVCRLACRFERPPSCLMLLQSGLGEAKSGSNRY